MYILITKIFIIQININKNFQSLFRINQLIMTLETFQYFTYFF